MTTLERYELDTYIATTVMQWKETRSALQSKHDDVPRYWQSSPNRLIRKSDWQPTTNLEQAMLVLDRCLQANGGMMTHIAKLDDKYIIYCGNDQFFSERVEAETLPLAICLFAESIICKVSDNKKQ